MKKVGARILLCLMLVIALVTSTLTAFAEPNTTETSTAEPNTVETPEGLDLSKFKSIDLKEVGGVYNGNLCIKDQYSYFLLYADKDSFYVWKSKENSDETVDNVFASISVDEANTYINDKSYYNMSYGYDDEYSIVDSISSLTEYSKSKKVYILLADDNGYYNLGLFDSYEDLEKISKLDLSTKLPELSVSVNKEESSADIVVKFSSNSGVSSIVCKDSNGDVVKTYDVPDEYYKGGACIFTVYNNDTYTIEGYNNYYVSDDEKHSTITVKVEGLVKSTPEEVTAKSVKAPKITFSKLPSSALVDSNVEITMYSDKPAKLVFNGQASDGYVKKMKVKVNCNGRYFYSATDKNSVSKDGKLKVNFFKNPEGFDDANRDNFWNNPNSPISTITSKLPQTGSVGWYWMIAFGVALIGVGGFVVFKATKSRKNKGIENK